MPASGKSKDFIFLAVRAVCRFPFHGQLTSARNQEVCRFVLVTKGVTANHNRLGPAWDETRNIIDDDGLTEDNAAENVADRAIRAAPHFLQAELFDPCFVWRDGRTFHSNAILLGRVCRIDCDLVVCLVPRLNRQGRNISGQHRDRG